MTEEDMLVRELALLEQYLVANEKAANDPGIVFEGTLHRFYSGDTSAAEARRDVIRTKLGLNDE